MIFHRTQGAATWACGPFRIVQDTYQPFYSLMRSGQLVRRYYSLEQLERLWLEMDVTLVEAAAMLGVTPATLRQQIANGKLRARKVGRDWQVTPREVERYRAASRRK